MFVLCLFEVQVKYTRVLYAITAAAYVARQAAARPARAGMRVCLR
jgi:hypothetical protein